MHTPERTIRPFNPQEELKLRWPDWRIHQTRLHGIDEVIDGERRLILLEPGRDGEDWAVCHALAHLELGHHETCGPMSRDEEEQADWLARLWLA